MVAVPAGQHALVAELEDQRLALRGVVELGRQRPDAGILVAQRKPRLALVRRDQIEAAEFGDIAPAARHLAVGDPVHAFAGSRRSASGWCGD